MRINLLVFCFLVSCTILSAQRLNYKLRTFGIGVFGNYGINYPTKIDNEALIEPSYFILNQVPQSFQDFQGNDLDEDRTTYTLGAYAQYRYSIGYDYIVTLMGGIAKSQVAHYLVNLNPLSNPSHSFDAWHEWYNINQYFAGIQLGIPRSRKKGQFWNFSGKISLANIGAPFFERDVRAYPGILESGERRWFDVSTQEGFTFTDRVNENEIYLSLGIGSLSQSGKYNHRAFEWNLSYNFALFNNLITTNYQSFKNGSITGEAQINFTGAYVALEAHYTIPLFYNRKKKGDKMDPENSVVEEETTLLSKDLRSCYKIKSRDQERINYHEDYLYFKGNLVELEIYHKDSQDDGDRISICADGKMALKNVQLTTKGQRFKLKTKGRDELYLIVYTHNRGSSGNNSLGLALVSGGQRKNIELDAFQNQYYVFKLMRQ